MDNFVIEEIEESPNDDSIHISDVLSAIHTVDPAMFGTNNPPGAESGAEQSMQPQQPSTCAMQQLPTCDTQQSAIPSNRRRPHVKIIEQPAGKALRFRYECEGRSAGSIPGVNSTPENKTFPTIEIVDYVGRAVVVVSCVTKDAPHKPHPHNLVGREGCKKGVCTVEINSETMRAVFSNLGIQCVKKKDIESALRAREEIRVDPFKTKFDHRFQPASLDLNSVRLCFQVFLESETKGRFTVPLPPVVSDPIYDKKAMSDLVICKLCKCSSTVAGGKEIILLCEKVAKEDISVRFFEEKDGQVVWEAYGEFQHTDVHKQTAINFRTPRYKTLEIDQPITIHIQLKRPSDGATSEPIPFDYLPLDSDPIVLKRKRQKFAGEARSHLFNHFTHEQNMQEQQHQGQDGGRPQQMEFLNIGPGTSIKTEPRDTSPLPYGMYPNTTVYRNVQLSPETSPSPQPLSPPTPLYQPSYTPLPYNIPLNAGGANMMSPNNQLYGAVGGGPMISPNHPQYGATGGPAPNNLSPNMDMHNTDMGAYPYQQPNTMGMYNHMGMQQMPQQQSPWTPTTTSAMHPLAMNNLGSNQYNDLGAMITTSAVGQHQQQQQQSQQQQQPHVSSLLNIDSAQLIEFNSAELSNLSLS